MTTYTMATPDEKLAAGARGTIDWLHLAAAPTFAVMAMLAGGSPDMLCATMHQASPLSGMTAMYLLMSTFHAAPWLRLISSRQRAARRS